MSEPSYNLKLMTHVNPSNATGVVAETLEKQQGTLEFDEVIDNLNTLQALLIKSHQITRPNRGLVERLVQALHVQRALLFKMRAQAGYEIELHHDRRLMWISRVFPFVRKRNARLESRALYLHEGVAVHIEANSGFLNLWEAHKDAAGFLPRAVIEAFVLEIGELKKTLLQR